MSKEESDISGVEIQRRFPVGAELVKGGGAHFRVWAPDHKKMELIYNCDGEEHSIELRKETLDYFSVFLPEGRAGILYRFKIDDNDLLLPDPASRFQPEGPHGPSELVDPDKFLWTDNNWKGIELKGQIIYEIHVGTFTKEGTWKSAELELQELADLGITILEIMPVADFPGRFGWGYDGVNLYAPTRLYGSTDDFRSFVNKAHEIGLGVILDVVYNHLGPDGNYLSFFSEYYFSKEKHTDWGAAINYDGEKSQHVREYFMLNALYWLDEFHVDGLRVDATQDIHDKSSPHILSDLIGRVLDNKRKIKVFNVGENEPQNTILLKSFEEGGYNFSAVWNDDFHHSAMVAMTGRNEAYYTDYLGKPQEFVSLIKHGYLYQGQWYKWQKKRRGTSTRNINPARFINYIQNHDQIANSGRGFRVHMLTSWGRYKAITALLLLAPGTPMLFQGQEFAASSPFYYFADHNAELADLVHRGRIRFLSQFRSLASPEIRPWFPVPSDDETFLKSKLNFEDRKNNEWVYQMHKDLIKIRKGTNAFRRQRNHDADGAVLSDEAFVIRFFDDEEEDKLLIVNLGVDLHYNPAPEPLLAPPVGKTWGILWSSESPEYGGLGTAPLDTEENWRIPGHAAVVLTPEKVKEITSWII